MLLAEADSNISNIFVNQQLRSRRRLRSPKRVPYIAQYSHICPIFTEPMTKAIQDMLPCVTDS
jgi:hypothetical protein